MRCAVFFPARLECEEVEEENFILFFFCFSATVCVVVRADGHTLKAFNASDSAVCDVANHSLYDRKLIRDLPLLHYTLVVR